jgi:hypothetical protein
MNFEEPNPRLPGRVQGQPMPTQVTPAPARTPVQPVGASISPQQATMNAVRAGTMRVPPGFHIDIHGRIVPVVNPANAAPGPGAPRPTGPGAPPPVAGPPAPPPFVPNAGGPGGQAPPPQGYAGGYAPPPPQNPGQPPQGSYNAESFNDPMNSFLAAVPMMNLNMKQQIGDAMATAGFDGNRYGTSAMNTAAQIGAQNSLAQNQLLQQTLSDFANKQQDRALTADQLGLQSASLQDQIRQNQLTTPFMMAQYEQGRQDNFSNQAYQDFEHNKLGYLPMLLQAANSQGAGSPGTPYTTTTPGTPGYGGLLSGILDGLFGGGG